MSFFVGISYVFIPFFATSSDREKDVILFLEKDNLAFVIVTIEEPMLELCVKIGLG